MGVRRSPRLLFDKDGQPPVPTLDNSLAKTAKDALHSRAERGLFAGFSSTGAVYEHIAEGHENYAKSFEKEKG